MGSMLVRWIARGIRAALALALLWGAGEVEAQAGEPDRAPEEPEESSEAAPVAAPESGPVPEESAEPESAEPEPEAAAADEDEGHITFGAWVEAYYAYNFNQPSNGITDLRGFDNRHNSFNLANVVLDAQWDWEGVNGRITLQWGSTPSTYYLAETATPTFGSGVGPQNQSLWQFVQQAYVGYHIDVGGGLDVQAGLFLSPIGVESLTVHEDYLFSRSNVFFGFPFYHTGVRATYGITPELSVSAWFINGWNTIVDNNDEKSFIVQLAWSTPGLLSVTLNYLGGVERPVDAPEGRAWRHVFDLNGTITPTEWLGIQAQATGGFEPNAFGTSAYMAGMLALHFDIVPWLALNARGDFFWEHTASNALGTASSIFWPTEWVSSATAGIDLRPHEHISLRIEYRHDHASGDAFFAGRVSGDGVSPMTPFVHNARTQDTLTIGTTAWF